MKWILLIVVIVVVLVGIVAIVGATLPRDHTATRRIRLRQTPAAVFAVLGDFASMPAWRSGVKRVEMLPPGNGQVQFREHSAHGAVAYMVEESRPPHRLVLRIADETLPYGGTWTIDLRAIDGGSEVQLTERGFVKNIIFRCLARFVLGYTSTLDGYLRDLGRKFGEDVMPIS